jgi:hypothetical protein
MSVNCDPVLTTTSLRATIFEFCGLPRRR